MITILKDWYEDPPKIICDENLIGNMILYYPNELGYIVLVLDKAHVLSILDIVPGSLIAANNYPYPLDIPYANMVDNLKFCPKAKTVLPIALRGWDI